MSSFEREFPWGCQWLLVLVCVGLSGCGSMPMTMYKIKEVDLEEEELPCDQLDDEVLKADAARWAMRQDGRVLAGDTAMTAATAANAVNDWMCSVFPGLATDSMYREGCPEYADPDHGLQMNVGFAHRQLNSADTRIVGLLRLKRSHACPAQPTSLPGLSDLDVLASLEQLAAERIANRVSDTAANAERTRLLDGLRAGETAGAPATPAETK